LGASTTWGIEKFGKIQKSQESNNISVLAFHSLHWNEKHFPDYDIPIQRTARIRQ